MAGSIGKLQKTLRALLLEYRSPQQLGFAVALGVFVGASPLWGFHTLLALGLALLFRLNKSAVLLGSFVSNPWFAPFLIYASLHMGSLLVHGRGAPLGFHEIRAVFKHPHWHELLQGYFLPYFCGAFVVAGLLAVFFYFLTLSIARRNGSPEQNHRSAAGD